MGKNVSITKQWDENHFRICRVVLILMYCICLHKVIDALIKEADEKDNTGIKTAWSEHSVRGEQMRYGCSRRPNGEVSRP